MVSIEASIIPSDYPKDSIFKNNTKTFNTLLCVNFLELFFSTMLITLCKLPSTDIVYEAGSFLFKKSQVSSFHFFANQT